MASGRGAVAAGHHLTAKAAADTLKAGGNAFDAVVAGLAMACVAEPVLASPGGGGFLMAREGASGETTCFDFFTQTPLVKASADHLDFHEITANFGPARQEFHIGRGASAVPGLVPGMLAIHARLCALPLDELFAPAIETARGGFMLGEFDAFLFTVVAPILMASESTRALFAPEGELTGAGERFANRGLADFFERLGAEGAAFHDSAGLRGEMLEGQHAGGHLRVDDFAGYRVEQRPPLRFTHKGADIALNPPPSAGGAYILHQLAGLESSTESGVCAIAVALSRTDRARQRLGGDLDAVLAEAGRRGASAASGGAAPRGTTHISVIDANGNAAALSTSNGEGNGHLVGSHGFMLNNMLGETDLNPDGFHGWTPGHRLSSMMAPAIISRADGSLIALGSGGSNRIRTAIFQVLVRLIDEGLTPAGAVAGARLHVENGKLDFEDDLGEDDREALMRNHDDTQAWPERNLFFGGVHVVMRDGDGGFVGAGDARRAGAYVAV